MTRRCVYCREKHIIGPDYGAPYTDGLCKMAYYRESARIFFRYEVPAFFRSRVAPVLHRAESLVWQLALVYLLAQVLRWSLKGFAVAA